ncbi:MAG TPA: RICIN domain-containing protein [Marinagarivorans sp.]
MRLVKILAYTSLTATLGACVGDTPDITAHNSSDMTISSASSMPVVSSSSEAAQMSSQGSAGAVESSAPSSSAAVSSSSVSSAAMSSSSEAPVPDATPVAMNTDRWYVLTNRENGLAFDIAEISEEPGAALTQWDRTDGENQQFRFVDSGENYYRIIARHSGLALDLYDFITDDGADIVQWEDLDGQNQQFQMLDLSNGYYQISNRLSGKVLAPEYNSDVAGTRITQYPRSAELAQQWQLVDFAAYTPTPDNGGGNTGECGAGTAEARVTGEPGNYQMNGQSFGNDYRGAIFAALGELSSGRTQQERIVIMASGDVGDARINLQSNTIFEVCGTINAAPASRGTITIWGSVTENISIPYLNMTGNTSFAMLIADTRNLHLGQIDLRLSGGAGIRFDNRGETTNVTIDSVYVEGTTGHGVETWNIDGLEIGTVVARDTGYAGLLLNNTRNANIGTVDGENTGPGTGYATLRFANTNGRINNQYPTNIYVDKLISRGGGRGLFCVSQSGGVEINSIDLANNGSNSALIENCYNVTINGGTVNGGGEFRIAARSEFANTRDLTVRNLRVSNTSVRESPCADNSNWENLTVTGGSRNICD